MKQKNKQKSIIRKFSFKLITLVLIAGAVLSLSIFPEISTHINNGFHKIMRTNGFSVQNVSLSGRKNADQSMIMKITGIQRGESIFNVKINEIQENLEKVGWIKSAVVERHFPNSIHISIKERHPIAIWQENGRLSLIDENGKIITKKNIGKFSYLKVLVGENANKNVLDFLRLIAKDPTLAKITTSGVFISKRRWNILLLNRITVKLPADNPGQAWLILSKYSREKKLLARPIESIDMRIPGKIFLKMREKSKKNKITS